MVSPVPPLPQAELKDRGWNWLPVATTNALKPKIFRIPLRLYQLHRWNMLGQGGEEILTLIGASGVRYGKIKQPLADMDRAWVLAGRCEFAGLIRFRQPGQRWVLDSNDTVTNLAMIYRAGDFWRRAAGIPWQRWINRLSREECRYAGQYERVISVSSVDQSFYASVLGESSVLEDSFIVLPDKMAPVRTEYDVGFIGGSHAAAVRAAENLIQIAGHGDLQKFRFAIAGRVCERLPGAGSRANVQLLGTIDNSLDFLRKCRAILMWSEQETGGSVKFQEALASGATVIANRNAARFSQAKAGLTHLEPETLEMVCQMLVDGSAFRFRPSGLDGYFRWEAYRERFLQALNWPSD